MTASTGMAAVNIGGCTVHSFAGIGLGEGPRRVLVARAVKTARRRWSEAECLIIDEVSMLSGDMIDTLDAVARAARRRPNVPFGGLQIVLVGDFCQLGPVKVEGEREYAFEAEIWDRAVQHHVYLQRVMRQEGSSLFAGILGEIRRGHVSSIARGALARCRRELHVENGVLPTKLHCTNRNVDVENALELAKLPGDVHAFRALDRGPRSSLDDFLKSCSAPTVLELKVGAQVVLLKNLRDTLVNGSRGVVTSFTEGGLPLVLFDSGMLIEIAPATWFREESSGEASREQIPLRLAWALTIHRCQGMTLDKVECSLSDAFAAGQVYVALSRVQSLAGLLLRSFDVSKVRVSPKVAAFYQSFRFSSAALVE
ncbi:unnamed protein product [Prorocentrum cordatum]|uniref:ATP-dependent DNA helicase n=1 Tax=Prorocentrum cordatum TaxID=2364126 RepID=A0ABN9RAP1_9DINO|nr:unnamed protein product [Polarella glacialis]